MRQDRNEQPHLLIAKVEAYGRYKSVSWSVECPYGEDDIRDCGVIEECTGSPKDAAKWGCQPRPVEPQGMPEGVADNRSARDEYLIADEEWQDEHISYSEGHGHRSGECWFTFTLAESDVEPEEILENIPDGTAINGPFRVEVHYEGSYHETSLSFTLWKDEQSRDDPS